jgi:hypothetical protein
VCVCVCVCVSCKSGSARAKADAEKRLMENYVTRSGSKQVEKIKAVFGVGGQGSAATARYDRPPHSSGDNMSMDFSVCHFSASVLDGARMSCSTRVGPTYEFSLCVFVGRSSSSSSSSSEDIKAAEAADAQAAFLRAEETRKMRTYMRACVCMYVCMHVYVNVYVCVCVCVCLCLCHTHTHTHKFVPLIDVRQGLLVLSPHLCCCFVHNIRV